MLAKTFYWVLRTNGFTFITKWCSIKFNMAPHTLSSMQPLSASHSCWNKEQPCSRIYRKRTVIRNRRMRRKLSCKGSHMDILLSHTMISPHGNSVVQASLDFRRWGLKSVSEWMMLSKNGNANSRKQWAERRRKSPWVWSMGAWKEIRISSGRKKVPRGHISVN